MPDRAGTVHHCCSRGSDSDVGLLGSDLRWRKFGGTVVAWPGVLALSLLLFIPDRVVGR